MRHINTKHDRLSDKKSEQSHSELSDLTLVTFAK